MFILYVQMNFLTAWIKKIITLVEEIICFSTRGNWKLICNWKISFFFEKIIQNLVKATYVTLVNSPLGKNLFKCNNFTVSPSSFTGTFVLFSIINRWQDGVSKACSSRSLELKDAKVKCMNGILWEDSVSGTNSGVNVYNVSDFTFNAKQWMSNVS